jgi:nucleotide-binding universal stress UspA family protein
MTTTQVFMIVAGLWALIGVTASIVMGRRGHSSFAWLLLGAFMGPLVIAPALGVVRAARRDPRARARLLREGGAGTGTVDVLVGIDGSVESSAALRAALDLFADRIGRLTLAAVIDYDSAISGRPWDTERLATEGLERSAASVRSIDPNTALLVGHPATALMKHAVEEGYEVLVVGRRGHGATKALLGSTAMRLAHGAGIPVVIV